MCLDITKYIIHIEKKELDNIDNITRVINTYDINDFVNFINLPAKTKFLIIMSETNAHLIVPMMYAQFTMLTGTC